MRLVLDNLNTRDASEFHSINQLRKPSHWYDDLSICFTEKSTSWPTMIEIEFSSLSKLCLNRRIPTMENLATNSCFGSRAGFGKYQD